MAAGQFTLAACRARQSVALLCRPGPFRCIGNGFFKANISTMVGELYREGDSRRAMPVSPYSIWASTPAPSWPRSFAPPSASRPSWGWGYGYFAAGCGMMLVGHHAVDLCAAACSARSACKPVRASAPLRGIRRQCMNRSHKIERDRLRVIFMLFIFVVLFWASFEQAGGLMNLYAEQRRPIASSPPRRGDPRRLLPIGELALHHHSGADVRGGMEPAWRAAWPQPAGTPIKMVLGLLLTGLGFVFMVGAVYRPAGAWQSEHAVADHGLHVPHHGRACASLRSASRL